MAVLLLLENLYAKIMPTLFAKLLYRSEQGNILSAAVDREDSAPDALGDSAGGVSNAEINYTPGGPA